MGARQCVSAGYVPLMQGAPISTTADWTQGFDDIIDCRSPAEFAHDHIPGAINCWSLDNEQREKVGTVYKEEGAFAGRRLGAGLVSINIGHHLATQLSNKPKEWRPLVYCWRGGQRSGALATVLGQIGYRVTLLQGGYKAYRNKVLGTLPEKCGQPDFIVLCGRTGVGKTRLLKALAAQGEQVLDLEGLASHRGSLFGALGLAAQPSPALFDSLLHHQLARFDLSRPIWTEAESAKVGALHLPKKLVERIRQAPRLMVEADLNARVATILADYQADQLTPELVHPLVDKLPARVSNSDRAVLRQAVAASDWETITRALIEVHYDPSYGRSMTGNFTGEMVGNVDLSDLNFDSAASACRSLALG